MPLPRLEPIRVPSIIFPKPSATYTSPICSSLIGQLLFPLTRPSALPSATIAFVMSGRVGKYCGFSRDNPILRVTLSPEEVRREARALLGQGFRNILLVSGEHPKFVSSGYMGQCVSLLHEEVPSLSLEIGPMETEEYHPLVRAGAEGLVVYHETYDRAVYSD